MFFKKKSLALAVSASIALTLSACSGDDGKNGANGQNGASSLIKHTSLKPGNSSCFQGGTKIESGLDTDGNGELSSSEITATSTMCAQTVLNNDKHFKRIATLPVCTQIDANCNNDTETAAEIVSASKDGMTLIYSDSPAKQIGFVNIADPSKPKVDGVLSVGGEPTSVSVADKYVLVGVNTSKNYVEVSGSLAVVDIATKKVVHNIDLGGQPDSVAVSPDGKYAAVVIENERDEDKKDVDGRPPQAPAGYFIVVKLEGEPTAWTTTKVEMTGLAELFADDPEPEYVDINEDNLAVVTLQENNHIVLVDLPTAKVTKHFSAGTVDLTQVDLIDKPRPNIVLQTESQDNVKREPDGVSWIDNEHFATADEGDLDGGSRGFTIFNKEGKIVWEAGSSLDHMAARFGHYPDQRSDAKGNEPENAEVGVFGDSRYLFVNSERASLVFVYDVADPKKPVFKQVLPSGVGPEGVLAIPSRNLVVAASEKDDRGDKMRSALNIYSYANGEPEYPSISSVDRSDGTPIPWSAMSGLAADPMNENILYSVEDSFFAKSRIFTLDLSKKPVSLTGEMRIMDSNDKIAALTAATLADKTVGTKDDTRKNVFDELDRAALVNDDKTVNIDPEGVAKAADGGFWVVSEGSGTVGDKKKPVNSLNMLIKTDANGLIEEVVTLPKALNDVQLRFGFEGVSEYNSKVYVAFQRAWNNEANPRIGIYDTVAKTWSFVFYPLDAPTSQNGGWVGLSDITSIDNGKFLVLERDNQGGPDATIKRIYEIDLSAATADSTITKTLHKDLMMDLKSKGGLVAEKVEGLAVTESGDVYIINDNDGVDDNSGETQLMKVGKLK